MRTSRLLGASLTTVLAVGLVGAITPPAAAGDNDRNDWDDKRVLQAPGSPDGGVHVLAGRNKWSMVARELGAGSETWRLRESTPGTGVGYTAPTHLPREVKRFRYDESQRQDATYAAYEYQGRLYGAEHSATGTAMTLPTNLAAVPDAAEAAKVAAAENDSNLAIITQGGTWHQHVGPVGGTDQPGARWVTYPDPNVDGVAGNAGEDYAFATSGHLLTFWNAANGDLRVARRSTADTTAAFSAPQTVAPDGEKYVRFVSTAQGEYLITQAANGAVSRWTHRDDAAGFSFTDRVQLVGPVTSGDPVRRPQVAVDALGTLTVGWNEPGVKGGGLVLWQQDRPESTYLERGNLVPGTRDTDARVVTSPMGSLTVAMRRDTETATIRVKHLPAGKAKWTDGSRLIGPKPLNTSSPWAIGSAQGNQDLRVSVNDQAGVYGFLFDAPKPLTKVTNPVRTTRSTKAYLIGWSTSWTFADDWQVRTRLDEGKQNGAWKPVSVPDGAQSKVVTRPRGKTFCYQAKAFLDGGQVTGWSKQRCVTVRR